MRDINVAFGVAGYGPLWAPPVESWIRAIAVASRLFTVTQVGKIGGAGITDRMYTHSAENVLADNFLSDPTYTHLFMTEMDMVIPPDAIQRLVEMDVPVASGIYFLRGGTGQPCLYQKAFTTRDNKYPHTPVTVFPTDKPFRVDCPGLGCVVFKREAFEKVKFPWFDLKEAGYGSDMYYYTKAKEAGVQVWANPAIMCDQISYTLDTYETYKRRVKEDPNFVKGGFIIGSTAPVDAIDRPVPEIVQQEPVKQYNRV
jgi:hypothetical protein